MNKNILDKNEIAKLSNADLLSQVKNNTESFKELRKRFKDSLLVELEINKMLNTIGEKKVKEWLKEIKK